MGPQQIDEHQLSQLAFDILVSDLVGHGNVLSEMHRAALFELVDTFTSYCTRSLSGRQAYPLPTGMGKTSAVVAFVAAAHQLGYRIPVSVAASRVEALCRLKLDMIEHGVPADTIGLKHSMPAGEATLMRADSFAFSARTLKVAVSALTAAAEGHREPLVAQLVDYLQESHGRINTALDGLMTTGDANRNGAEVRLGELEEGVLEVYGSTVRRFERDLRGLTRELVELLLVSQDTLRVVGSEQGDGVVTAREVVPPALRDVVILDASAPIRDLAKLDPTIKVVENFEAADLKSFERVEVRQLLSPGGRSSMGESLRAERQEASAVALEVAAIIKEGWDTEKAFLVFTFVRRGALDMVDELKKDLRRAGIDVDTTFDAMVDGKVVRLARVNWLTWGSETSLNGFEHCTSVVMAGVLHRSHLDLAAAVRGQTGNPAEPTPGTRIRELIESELASCIYQGASRGSCRRIDHGKAQAMRLWFVHRDPRIKVILDKVMPGAQWSYPEPKHLRKATADSKAARLLEQLLGHLRELPSSVQEVSSKKLKVALALGSDNATRLAFGRACELLELDAHGWVRVGRSIGRGAAVYGFPSTAG